MLYLDKIDPCPASRVYEGNVTTVHGNTVYLSLHPADSDAACGYFRIGGFAVLWYPDIGVFEINDLWSPRWLTPDQFEPVLQAALMALRLWPPATLKIPKAHPGRNNPSITGDPVDESDADFASDGEDEEEEG